MKCVNPQQTFVIENLVFLREKSILLRTIFFGNNDYVFWQIIIKIRENLNDRIQIFAFNTKIDV